MVDTVTTTTNMGNDNDDWEVAVDTGEFDKRLEQQEKARVANQEPAMPVVSSSANDDDNRTSSSINLLKSNKPIRILKRPTSQSQLPTNTDVTNSSTTTTTTTTSAMTSTNTSVAASTNDNHTNPNHSSSSSSTTVPVVSIIPRNQSKDSTNSSESLTNPSFSSTSAPPPPVKPPIKTYEQRELEYRLARLRIMGEEESSAKDDDDDSTPSVEPTSLSTDDNSKTNLPYSSSSTTRPTTTTNKMSGFSQPPPLQSHSTPGSYASDLYTLNNVPSNTGTIHFTPNHNNTTSTPNLGPGPFSSPNFPPHYRHSYSAPYSHLIQPPPQGVPRYPLTAPPNSTLYRPSTSPFVNAHPSSSSGPSSYRYPPPPPHPSMTTNNWYPYQHPPAPYGAQQFGHPQ